jgi:predicted transposase YbfD/YdcC
VYNVFVKSHYYSLPKAIHDAADWCCIKEGHWSAENRLHRVSMQGFRSSDTSNRKAEGNHEIAYGLSNA